MIYMYAFDDGTILTLLDVGLSVAEVWKLAYESWKTTMNYPVQLWNRRVESEV